MSRFGEALESKLTQHASLGFRVWRGRPNAMVESHQHADVELNFMLAGSMSYFIGGRHTTLEPRRLGMFWGGAPHALVRTEPETECFWITIPLAWFLGWELPQPLVRRLLRGELLVDPSDARAARDEADQRDWATLSASRSAEHGKIVRLEVEARTRRLAVALAGSAASAERVPDPRAAASLAERIAEFLGARYTERLSIDAIAEAVGTHPSQAMRVFKKTCGMSIGDYLTGLRVSQAQRLLIESDAKILDIALRSGFGSSSRFYDAFASVVGQTPSQYRDALSRR